MFGPTRKYGARGLMLALIALGAASLSAPAFAQHRGGGFHGGVRAGHGGYHGGYRGYRGYRGGWGLGVGVGVGVGFYDPWWPGWYGAYDPYYSYSYAVPPVVVTAPVNPVVQAPPAAAASYYYYCDNPAGYYPTVQTCAQPWRQVTPPPQQ